MEMETCSKCKSEAKQGTLVRDSVDAALLYCEACKPKKPRKPRKRKEKPVIAPVDTWTKAEEIPVVDLVALTKEAAAWAEECGIKSPLVTGPTREDFPRYGFGYSFTIREGVGKGRMATARYTSRGERSFWTMDGIVTG